MPDTVETGNYLQVDAPHYLSTKLRPPIIVGFQNGQTIQSSKPCLIYFPALNEESCGGHIISSLANISLVSIGKLCDAGYTAEFKVQEVTIKRKGKIIVLVPRDRNNGLQKIPLTV